MNVTNFTPKSKGGAVLKRGVSWPDAPRDGPKGGVTPLSRSISGLPFDQGGTSSCWSSGVRVLTKILFENGDNNDAHRV